METRYHPVYVPREVTHSGILAALVVIAFAALFKATLTIWIPDMVSRRRERRGN